VRLIAGVPDDEKPEKIAAVRRMGWALSLLGLALALILSWPVGIVTFASSQYFTEMAIVACAVPCVIASSAWSAVLQASGKVASLAKVQISGALTGLLLGLPAICIWGTIGIALSILLAAALPAFVLWRTARSESAAASFAQAESADIRQLIRLGGALMIVGWLGQLSAYAVRLVIVQQEGLDAAGYYQAAYAIAGSLPGFVFSAMGADFFPRVTATKNDEEADDITDKQIMAAMLLGVPFIAVLMAAGHLAVRLLYSDSFIPSVELLRWMTWGVFVRLFTWPLGFRLLAKGSPLSVVAIEASACVASILAPMILMPYLGLSGAGIGFLLGSVFYGAGLLIVTGYIRRVGTCTKLAASVLASSVMLVQQLSEWSQVTSYVCAITLSLTCVFILWKNVRKDNE
jgi:PST family polysaccharide transporter